MRNVFGHAYSKCGKGQSSPVNVLKHCEILSGSWMSFNFDVSLRLFISTNHLQPMWPLAFSPFEHTHTHTTLKRLLISGWSADQHSWLIGSERHVRAQFGCASRSSASLSLSLSRVYIGLKHTRVKRGTSNDINFISNYFSQQFSTSQLALCLAAISFFEPPLQFFLFFSYFLGGGIKPGQAEMLAQFPLRWPISHCTLAQ